jgi:predicted secreted hydrolase
MKREWLWLVVLVLVVGCGGEPTMEAAKPLQVATLLGGNAEADAGFTRATAPVPLVFPQDHGPHPAYRSEWWYWTGNLKTAAQAGDPRLGLGRGLGMAGAPYGHRHCDRSLRRP